MDLNMLLISIHVPDCVARVASTSGYTPAGTPHHPDVSAGSRATSATGDVLGPLPANR